MPRTSTRNRSRYSGRSSGCRTVSVSSRSKPNSSTSYSPVSRRRRKARAPATRRSHTSGSGGSGGGATARRLRSGAGRGWAAARLSKSVMGVSPRSGPAAPQPGQDALLGGADRLAGQYAADATQEVLERDRGRARDHAELADQPAGVHHPAVHEQVELVEAEVRATPTSAAPSQRRQGRLRDGYPDPPGPPYRLGQRDDAGPGDVEGTRVGLGDRPVHDLQRVVDVDELQPRIPAEHGRHDRP